MALTAKNKLIFLILLLALGLRLIALDQSFWLDEAIGALAAKNYSYWEILNQFMKADNHSPLYYLLIKFWSSLFGFSEVAIRSLGVLFSLVAIYFTYKLAKLITKNEFVAIFASIFLATSQFFVYFSQEARMYVPAAAFAVTCLYFYLKTSRKENNLYWIYFAISLAGLFFIDYVPVFMYPVFVIYAIVNKQRKNWWVKFALSHIILILFGILWLPIFKVQLQNSPYTLSVLPDWADLAGGATFKQLALVWIKFIGGRISLLNKKIYYLYIIFASIPFLFAATKNINKKYLIIKLFLIFPIISLFLASLFFPGFNYFRLTFVYPAFAILVAVGVKNYKKLALIILVINFIGLGIYYFSKNTQREQWRQTVQWIESDAQNTDLAIFEFSAPFAPYEWYESGKLDAIGGLKTISANTEGTEDYINSLLVSRNTIYHFEYLRDLTDPMRKIEKILQENDFKITSENANFVGVGKITKWQR